MDETAREPARTRRLSRIRDWVADRLERMPLEAWPFIVLAVFVVAANRQAVLSGGSLYLLLLASLVAGALLPAAILIGCRDAWWSARLVLVGAAVWTSIPVAVDVISSCLRLLSPEVWTDTSIVSGLQIARDLTAIASLAGPALVAIGLLQRRRTEATWPKALVALVLIGTAALCVYAASSAIDQYENFQSLLGTGLGVAFGISDPLFVVSVALDPMRVLTVGALAWSSLSAVRASEEPRRFWSLVSAGSAVLLGLTILSVTLGLAEASGALAPDTYLAVFGPISWVESLAELAGMALLLVGFGLGLPVVGTVPVGGEGAVTLAN
jgi:hypothetical protein